MVLVINLVFALLYIIIIIRTFLPFFPNSRFKRGSREIYLITDPIFSKIQLAFPPQRLGMDPAPFILIILLFLCHRLLLFLVGGI